MRRISKLIIFISVFLMFNIPGVYAAPDGYNVKPHVYNQDLIDKGLIDSEGADSTITFWDLPLWFQLLYISGFFASCFAIFEITPIIFGRNKDLCDNHNRKAIFEFVSKNPGCSIAEVSETLEINRGSVKYHIKKFNSQSKITIAKIGKFTRLFVMDSGIFDDEEKMIISFLRNETCRNLLIDILENPGITNRDLAENFGLDRSTVHWYLDKFQNLNLIKYVPEGKCKRCFLNPVIEQNLAKYIS